MPRSEEAPPDRRFAEHFMTGRLELDARLYYCGRERCQPGHQYGPTMRDHYLIHFVVSGKGTFKTDGCEYALQAGDCFCMFPNRPASYRASETEPWTYYWVGMGGKLAPELLRAAGFSQQSPTAAQPAPEAAAGLLAELLRRSAADDPAAELHGGGLLLQLFGTFLEGRREARTPARRQEGSEAYVARAVKFIEQHYQSKLTISLIARHVGLDRAYFTKLFHARTGAAPYEFLLRYRMEKARLLLSRTSLPVQIVASSAGFGDAAYFGKVFSRLQGMSPTAYRNRP
ncbi:AraC family transcriptional regulator [Paenibacillus sp. MWE-103]|uniref:AraC family transcriptional regulator n=1 Tax=Paenibacillus artemisiicola TaxID=1172618 RepID=A0ABS3WEZ7_9BACL|nr:AraC family transcriptional regulator [Paenibacillus artemisiicola]MBO7746887.1 AraC family transcriptional regulator [Paenibacillus artemisiicola]